MNWFQIPASDRRPRKQFSDRSANRALELPPLPGMQMWGFPADWEQGEIRGRVSGEGAVPSATGTVVFLTGDPDLQAMLDRVEPAGGGPDAEDGDRDGRCRLLRDRRRHRGQHGRAAFAGLRTAVQPRLISARRSRASRDTPDAAEPGSPCGVGEGVVRQHPARLHVMSKRPMGRRGCTLGRACANRDYPAWAGRAAGRG